MAQVAQTYIGRLRVGELIADSALYPGFWTYTGVLVPNDGTSTLNGVLGPITTAGPLLVQARPTSGVGSSGVFTGARAASTSASSFINELSAYPDDVGATTGRVINFTWATNEGLRAYFRDLPVGPPPAGTTSYVVRVYSYDALFGP
jgi:hypothetical protein